MKTFFTSPAIDPLDPAAMIPVMRPRLPPAAAILPYLLEIDASRVYANFGPLECRLRDRLGAIVSCDPACVVTFANATLALAGLVATSDIDEWEVPCFTFPATAHAVAQAGKRLIIRDVTPDTMRIASPATAIGGGRIDVMAFGAGVPRELLETECPALIIDAAASLGAANAPLHMLRPQDAVVFSLHATKVLGCGEGAFAVCGTADHARRLRTWTNFGFRSSRDSQAVGTNAKLGEYAAAVAHAALDDWASAADAWRSSQRMVRTLGRDLGLRSLPPEPPEVSPYWIVLFDTPILAELARDTLTSHAIETRKWWSLGLHRMPAFSGVCAGPYPVTDWLAQRYLGLPMFPDLTPHQVDRIRSALGSALTRGEQLPS